MVAAAAAASSPFSASVFLGKSVVGFWRVVSLSLLLLLLLVLLLSVVVSVLLVIIPAAAAWFRRSCELSMRSEVSLYKRRSIALQRCVKLPWR